MQDAAPKAPLRVSVGELSWSHAKHGSMTEGEGSRNRFAVCIPANSGAVANSPIHVHNPHLTAYPLRPPSGATSPSTDFRGRGGLGAAAPVLFTVALRLISRKNEKMSTEFETSVDKYREKALASPSIRRISRQNRKKLHRLFKVCGECLTPEFLLTLPEDLAILFMKSGATGSRFPTECYKK